MRGRRFLGTPLDFSLCFLRLDTFEEPCLSVGPLPLDRAFGEIQNLGNFRFSKASKKTQFHNLRLLRGGSLQLFERIIELKHSLFWGWRSYFNFIQRKVLNFFSVPHAQLTPGAV